MRGKTNAILESLSQLDEMFVSNGREYSDDSPEAKAYHEKIAKNQKKNIEKSRKSQKAPKDFEYDYESGFFYNPKTQYYWNPKLGKEDKGMGTVDEPDFDYWGKMKFKDMYFEGKEFDEFIEDNNKKVAPLVKISDDPIEESSTYTEFETFKPASRDIQKMEEYKAKGSNPKTLANTVKDKDKAISRYYIAFNMGWEECALEFARRSIELGYTQDNIEEIANKLEDGSQGIDLNKFKKKLEAMIEDLGLEKSASKARKTVQAKVEFDNPF